MARLRMDGVTDDSVIPTPPAGKATLFYNDTDGAYKVKYSDGSVQTLGSGGGGAVASVNGQTGTVVLTKSDIGLDQVNNTSDLNKPISTATASALSAKYDASNPAAYVDAAGAAAAAPVQSVAGQTGAVVLSKSDVGLSNVDNTSDADKPISDATATALSNKYDASNPANYIDAAGAPVQSVAGKTGTVTLDKADVGLSNVDNTSDADKPISDATATALSNKYDASNPANYVDAAGAAAAAPVQSVAGKTGVVTLDKADVGLSNVDNTSDADKPISDATQLALGGLDTRVTTLEGKHPIDLAADVTGVLTAANGGTGITEFPAMQLLFGSPDSQFIDRSEFFTFDASIGLLLNVGGQMQTRSLAQEPTDPSAVVIYDKVEVIGDDGTGPAYSRLKRDYVEAKKVLPTKELSASMGFDSVDSWVGVSETTNAGNNISMAKIFPNKAQLFTVDIGLGNGPQPILPVEPYDLTTKQYVDDAVAGAGQVDSVNGQTGVVVLTASDVGLGSVDNTSDLDKPISTATATALSGKLSLSGGTMTGAINMGSQKISSLLDPSLAQDAATKNYVDSSIPALAVNQVRYVSKNGNDSTGTGSFSKPFLTIAAAMTSITDSSPTNRYAIMVAPGNYTETGILYLKPNVFVVGSSKESVRISATSFQLHSTFNANSSFDNRSGFSRLSLLNACDFNWNTVQSAAGKLYFNEVSFSSTINLYGYNNAIAQAQFDSCLLFGALTISGINVGVFNNNICYSNITLNQHPNGGMATILNAVGGYCGGTYSATTTVTDFNRRCAGFARSFLMGTVTLNGASVYLDYTVDSLPTSGASVSNGANLVAMNASGGANTALSNLVYPTAVNQPIMPATTGATNLGDWGKQWAWHFAYVHASSGSDCYLISYPSSYGADSSGKGIGIYTDGAGLQADVNGGSIDMETAGVSGTGIRGNIRMNARNIDHTKTPSVNFVIENGDTASRPASPVVGQMYFDTTLGKPLWHNGTVWVDATGAAV